MCTWKIIILLIIPCYATDGLFECGKHGRFEYCIDGIPGCVTGCHCHPGYYFDTETKICEPNTKLTQNYRRQFNEPTRIQNPIFLSDSVEVTSVPTLTTLNILDEHVNDITKNADDLGDWLYNQFFKTIENQVINNTNKDSELTRRSGRVSDTKRNKSKRRTRKRDRNRHKKKRRKGIKQKFLEIAEDDSLFESSHSSDSDDDTGSSDSSQSSFESNSDEHHGHKKILMINKKPKPPLPSFIFLPHMDTPFYPPIGLPPPPVMPMYPLIPVPPVMPAPPMLPFPVPTPNCSEQSTLSTTIASTSTELTTEKVSSTTEVDVDKENTTEKPANKLRHRGKKKGKDNSIEELYDNLKSNRNSRQKLLQQLRNRNNHPALKKNKISFDNYMDQLIPPDNNRDDMFKNDKSPIDKLEVPEQENVDFKYLSQLIHRSNKNQTRDLPLSVYNPNNSFEKLKLREWSTNKYRDYNVPLNSRRKMSERIFTVENGQTDDTYYSNLGRQIATLIRTIDADNERQYNIEIEKVPPKVDDRPFFNENAPRTYWERSVRSPLKYFNFFKNTFDYLKNSNELLFNIENKIETIASTAPTLSLPEIENMINVMETAQVQFRNHDKVKKTNQSAKTLNINLWPQELKQFSNSIKSFPRLNVSNINGKKFINANNVKPDITNTYLDNVGMRSSHIFKYSGDNIEKSSKHNVGLQPILKSTSTKLYFVRNKTETTYPQKSNRLAEQKLKTLQYIIKPTTVHNKNIKKYFFDDNNHYSFQNDNLLLQYSSAKAITKSPRYLIKSPYFHQQKNYADYIEY